MHLLCQVWLQIFFILLYTETSSKKHCKVFLQLLCHCGSVDLAGGQRTTDSFVRLHTGNVLKLTPCVTSICFFTFNHGAGLYSI